jgi:hypothetical protein
MEVITQYPIVVTDSTAQSESEYRSTYSAADGEGASIGTMEVLTDYPIVYTDSNAQSISEYRRTYSAADGEVVPSNTMVVSTKYPIVVTDSTAQSDSEYRATYSAAIGDWFSPAAKARRQKARDKRRSEGKTFGARLGNFAKTDLGKSLVGKLTGNQGDQTGAIDTSYVPTTEPEGMSKGMKIGLVVGGVAILGLGAWLLMRKK